MDLTNEQLAQFIGARLKRFRTARGLSQTELGEIMGVSFQQVQKFERGVNRIMVVQLVRAAGALGRQVSDFLPSAAEKKADGQAVDVERALASPVGVRLVTAFAAIVGGKAREAAASLVEALAAATTSLQK